MSQVTLHGKPIKVGDKVWNIYYGWLTVTYVTAYSPYPITADNCSFTENGYHSRSEESPSLFWKEQEFDLSKPLPDLKMDDKVVVINGMRKMRRYFSHFNKEGNIAVFKDGKTSWNTEGTEYYSAYEIVEED